MQEKTNAKTVEAVERERERATFRKIDFICDRKKYRIGCLGEKCIKAI